MNNNHLKPDYVPDENLISLVHYPESTPSPVSLVLIIHPLPRNRHLYFRPKSTQNFFELNVISFCMLEM